MPEFPDSGGVPFDAMPEPPEHLEGHDSVWNASHATILSGGTEQDRDDFADAHYFGYVQRDSEGMTPEERSEWRDYADAMRDEWDIELDWDAWREEMGYN